MIIKEINDIFNNLDTGNRIKFLEAVNQLSPQHQGFMSKAIELLLELQKTELN